MTGEQKAWLDAHRAEGYRVMGNTPGASRWVRRGMLHPDGSFEPYLRARPSVRVGSFEVGILETREGPNMAGP